jgi:uncharacterized protein
MTPNFAPVALDRQSEYLEYLRRSPWEASDYSFINLWGWGPAYDLEWSMADDLVWIRQKNGSENFLWAPVGRWDRNDWDEVLSRRFPGGANFIRVPGALLERWRAVFGDRISWDETRGHWDYLYAVSELVDLQGNRFHKKKNLLNQFVKKYDYEYVPLDAGRVREALDTQEEWCRWRDCESDETLEAENRAIVRVFEHWDDLDNLLGGGLLVDGDMVAFTVGERMDADHLLIHFEKGMIAFKGVYQAINRMFLADHDGFEIVNREQDLDDPGIRKAKESYNPVDYVRKYRVVFKG